MTETLVGQFPKHIGSTGGLLNSAETEEKYAIVWKSSKEQPFELPTGGAVSYTHLTLPTRRFV